MKKTMVFENETAYDDWFDINEEKEGGHDFIKDRVVIVKGTRTIQNKDFNGFCADATINCKNVKTAIRRFIKEVKNSGFEISEDDFESNVNCFADCGFLVEIEETDEGKYYVRYMCYQDEVKEEKMETATEELYAPEHFERLTRTLYKSLFKAIGLTETRKIPFIISNNMVFFNYNGIQYKYYPSQCKVFKKCGRKYQRINWKHFAEENNPEGQKQKRGRSPPFTPVIRSSTINDLK